MDAELTINVARWLPRSSVNGPGERFVLWVQGCPLRCPGCWNPDTWSFGPRRIMTVAEVANLITASGPIDGVTFTGGEPFAQAAGLAALAVHLRDRNHSLMAFTGYELHELTSPDQRRLLANLDILVAGRFLRGMKQENLRWRGSTNQQVHFLTDRHTGCDEGAHSDPSAEIVIDTYGRLAVTGFPGQSLLTSLTVRGQLVAESPAE